MVGPFIFLDHAGPLHLPPDQLRNADVRPHLHIGLSTVSYLFDGGLMPRDSLGAEQAIRPGEVNWMTVGRGIDHRTAQRSDGTECVSTVRYRRSPCHEKKTKTTTEREDPKNLNKITY